jgi:hypothetical protein
VEFDYRIDAAYKDPILFPTFARFTQSGAANPGRRLSAGSPRTSDSRSLATSVRVRSLAVPGGTTSCDRERASCRIAELAW